MLVDCNCQQIFQDTTKVGGTTTTTLATAETIIIKAMAVTEITTMAITTVKDMVKAGVTKGVTTATKDMDMEVTTKVTKVSISMNFQVLIV